MTENEWMTCTDPRPRLEYLRGRATNRKLRLFAVACGRRVWHLLVCNELRGAVEVAEHYAEGAEAEDRLAEAHEAAELALLPLLSPPDGTVGLTGIDRGLVAHAGDVALGVSAPGLGVDRSASRSFPRYCVRQVAASARDALGGGEGLVQATLLRCVYGPLPFGPVAIDPSVLAWNDRTVPRLAQAIYDQRRWGDMPILGDALLDAGCDNDEVVAHCRAGGEHVRGCWVVDLLLGKE
jgi:hypothetical protein